MFASNNILSALTHSDPILFGEVVIKDFTVIADQESGLFQLALQGAGKEAEMETLLELDQVELDQEQQGQQERAVSSQEILSALSFLSIVGVVPSQGTLPPQGTLPLDESPHSDTLPERNKDLVVASFAMYSNYESSIQAILENATPSYVAQKTASDPTLAGHVALISNSATALNDSDLDTLISSILLSKNKVDTSDAMLADLRWNHFNETILTDADNIDNNLKGFTFETEDVKGDLLLSAEPKAEQLKVSSKASNSITLQAKLVESLVANGQNLPDSDTILNEDDFLTSLADSKPKVDSSVIEQIGSLSLQQTTDSVKTNAYTPEWRPEAQVAEHEIVKQVADKLSVQRLNTKGSQGVTIELEPKELGALKIEISVHKNFVSADILTQHASVRDILDKNQGILRDAMANMGFTVDHFSVNVGDFSHLPQHSSGHAQFNEESGTKFALLKESDNSAESALAVAGSGSSYWGNRESAISVYV
jgi:flagellar hook-length control protein FliK